MSSSALPGGDQTSARVPVIGGLKPLRAPRFPGLLRRGLPEPDMFGHHRTVPSPARQGELPIAIGLTADSAVFGAASSSITIIIELLLRQERSPSPSPRR